jgi:N-acetylglucosaminyldiphosphoundecaprenol N-acetyl-beta-D-mannosaminyltransferase
LVCSYLQPFITSKQTTSLLVKINKNNKLNSGTIFNVPINSCQVGDMLGILTSLALDKNGQKIVFTPNPEFIVKAQHEPDFKSILQSSDINIPDGVGIILASKILGTPVLERICGSDMTEKLLEIGNKMCNGTTLELLSFKQHEVHEMGGTKNEMGIDKLLVNGGWTIGIVGARKGDLAQEDELLRVLKKKYPNIRFVKIDDHKLQFSVYNVNSTSKECKLERSRIIDTEENEFSYIRDNLNFNIVFACHGMGIQEKWILENKNVIKTGIFMGVGGSLDFICGFTARAPLFIRKIWFEWLWRILQKPSHLKRVWNAIFVFGWIVLKEKLKLT